MKDLTIKFEVQEIHLQYLWCFCCGKEEQKTMHHAVPQTYKPKYNVVFPICRPCHDRIHAEEPGTLLKFAWKINKQTSGLVSAAHKLISAVKGRDNKKNDENKLVNPHQSDVTKE